MTYILLIIFLLWPGFGKAAITITDLGAMQQSATPWIINFAKIGSGNMYSYLCFGFPTKTKATNLFSLNHNTGKVIGPIAGPAGRIFGCMQHPNGLVYLATSIDGNHAGRVASFNFITGEMVDITGVPTVAGTPVTEGAAALAYSDEPHQRIFSSGIVKPTLFAIDPEDGNSIQTYGILDDPGGPAYTTRFVSSMQVDKTYAYCALKGFDGLQYLVVVNLATGAQTNIWKGTAGLTLVEVHRGWFGGDAEKIFFKKSVGNPAIVTWYRSNGTGPPILLKAEPSYYPAFQRNYINYTGYALDASLASPDGLGGKTITLQYKKPGDTRYRQVTADLIDLDSYRILGGGPDLDNNLIVFAEQYGATTKLITATDTKARMGIAGGLSGYSLCRDYFRKLMFFGGYPNTETWQYDPSRPWVSGTNPKKVRLAQQDIGGARYIYFIERGFDGNIWWVAYWIRSVYESNIVWYNPDTRATGSIWAMDETATKETGNLNQYVMDNACMNRARTKLLFSGVNKNSPIDSLVAVINLSKKKIQKYLTPITGGASQGRLVGVETNKATTNYFVGITKGKNYQAYCVDIGTGALIWGPTTYTGTSSFVNGPDAGQGPEFAHGYVWFYVGSNICKMNPATGEVTPVQAVTSSGQMKWIGDVLYHWDDTTKHLYKITGIY